MVVLLLLLFLAFFFGGGGGRGFTGNGVDELGGRGSMVSKGNISREGEGATGSCGAGVAGIKSFGKGESGMGEMDAIALAANPACAWDCWLFHTRRPIRRLIAIIVAGMITYFGQGMVMFTG